MIIKSFEMNINTMNAAFDEAPEMELSRILREVASKLECGIESQNIRDINGNTIGEFNAKTT